VSEKVSGFVVVLDSDLKYEDAQATISALKRIRGVVSADPILTNVSQQIAQIRAERVIEEKLWRALHEPGD
jgi:uncharacterized protein (DUF885 family)